MSQYRGVFQGKRTPEKAYQIGGLELFQVDNNHDRR